LLVCILIVSGCSNIRLQQEKSPQSVTALQVKLNPYKQSDFNQVEATFFTHQPKELVFRVLSDVKQTSQWLDRLESIEVLAVYSNHQYLLRSIIDSPWPFNDREIITCVNTDFNETITTIKIFSCSHRVPFNAKYLRLLQVESSWTIKETSNSLVEVTYKNWIEPSGYVPAFIFNNELIDNTKFSLQKLQVIIENAVLDQYSY